MPEGLGCTIEEAPQHRQSLVSAAFAAVVACWVTRVVTAIVLDSWYRRRTSPRTAIPSGSSRTFVYAGRNIYA